MRILLIATNRHRRLMSRMNARPVPIGLAYIAAHLDPERHDLKVLDLMFSEDYLGGDRTRRQGVPAGTGGNLPPQPGQFQLHGSSMGAPLHQGGD